MKLSLLIAFLAQAACALDFQQAIVNPNFSDGLTGWTVEGLTDARFLPVVGFGGLYLYMDEDEPGKRIHQTFFAEAGVTLSGSATFSTAHTGFGLANITINGQEIWRGTDPEPHRIDDWGEWRSVGEEFWQYTILESGMFTLSLNMHSGCDHGQSVLFSGISLAAAPVPDGGLALLLLGLGVGLMKIPGHPNKEPGAFEQPNA